MPDMSKRHRNSKGEIVLGPTEKKQKKKEVKKPRTHAVAAKKVAAK